MENSPTPNDLFYMMKYWVVRTIGFELPQYGVALRHVERLMDEQYPSIELSHRFFDESLDHLVSRWAILAIMRAYLTAIARGEEVMSGELGELCCRHGRPLVPREIRNARKWLIEQGYLHLSVGNQVLLPTQKLLGAVERHHDFCYMQKLKREGKWSY